MLNEQWHILYFLNYELNGHQILLFSPATALCFRHWFSGRRWKKCFVFFEVQKSCGTKVIGEALSLFALSFKWPGPIPNSHATSGKERTSAHADRLQKIVNVLQTVYSKFIESNRMSKYFANPPSPPVGRENRRAEKRWATRHGWVMMFQSLSEKYVRWNEILYRLK